MQSGVLHGTVVSLTYHGGSGVGVMGVGLVGLLACAELVVICRVGLEQQERSKRRRKERCVKDRCERNPGPRFFFLSTSNQDWRSDDDCTKDIRKSGRALLEE